MHYAEEPLWKILANAAERLDCISLGYEDETKSYRIYGCLDGHSATMWIKRADVDAAPMPCLMWQNAITQIADLLDQAEELNDENYGGPADQGRQDTDNPDSDPCCPHPGGE